MKISRVDSLPIRLRTMDFSFAIDEEVIEPFDGALLQTKSVSGRQKTYPFDNALFDEGAGRDRCLMIAERDDAIIGYAVAEKAWNGCAEVSEFVVAREFRRLGVATVLMNEIVTWARSMLLPAIRLETQTSNV